MKAIPTAYKGYHFRSRLEARWAVFFDTIGLEWDYEPEGFELANGVKYLPDFFIKGNGWRGPYIEVKPERPSDQELRKLCLLCEEKSAYGLLVWGDPLKGGAYYIHKEGHVECELSGVDKTDHWLFISCGSAKMSDFAKAVQAFRSARFEFGTSGASL